MINKVRRKIIIVRLIKECNHMAA